ncbi:phospholipase D/nuclease [Durotheca rogersii]|uniref:phospholipase D/nuclease n=1 Tax=Durotheca rogersii TaxID=419775 RepID=UPI00221F0ECD|nr:phospholipase D/nuclease [Durotheca rogersii]KAI5865152.1 phospholipase D/nuclease [Durotheca rogersii]
MDRIFQKAENLLRDAKEALTGDHEERFQPKPNAGAGEGSQYPDVPRYRFQSFAPETSGAAKWYIDGASYFHAVSMALEEAKESIYILDWWLSPELYLRRPPSRNERYRLDNMLRAAAERGVEVRIIVYKEVTQALTLDSAHTKHHLEDLHPNIKVFRHPDHLPTDRKKLETAFAGFSLDTIKFNDFSLSKFSGDALKELYGSFGDTVLYWAHHEKLCVIDRRIAFMGGLDMCFGRYDTMSHPIADAHPGNLDEIVFPGQDFNNARVYDFEGVDNWDHNQLDRTKNSRMGWSDITISLKGPIVGSLIDHFKDRWNFIFDEKYSKRDQGKYQRIELGGSSQESRGGEEGGERQHHFLDDFSRGIRHFIGEEDDEHRRGHQRRGSHGSSSNLKIQLCRSCCEWSGGHPPERSIFNAYVNAIENAKHFVYIENQFFITATSEEQRPVYNKIGASIVSRIVRAHNNGENFQIIVLMPAVPAFAGDLQADGSLGTRAIMEFQYNSINRGSNSIIGSLQRRGVHDWRRYIGFYNLRNYDRINISSTLRRAERESGVSYENARREYDESIGGYPYSRRDTGREYGGDDHKRDSYDRYQAAASHLDNSTWDTVSSCYMEGGQDIRDVPWDGSEEAELDAFVSEELYIHSKVLIADDRLVICGSANLNDRSQLGTHDSEIAVVIEDGEPVESYMDGRPYTASRFATSLRRQLYRKHLGLVPDERWDRPNANWTPVDCDPQQYDWGSRSDRLVEDPLSADFRRLWEETARTNTEVFSKVFHPVPNDQARTWEQYQDFFTRHFTIPGSEEEEGDRKKKKKEEAEAEADRGDKVAYGHVVRAEFPGGVAEVKDWLSRVRGTLVEMPLDFLIEVDDIAKAGLSLNAFTDEIYT